MLCNRKPDDRVRHRANSGAGVAKPDFPPANRDRKEHCLARREDCSDRKARNLALAADC